MSWYIDMSPGLCIGCRTCEAACAEIHEKAGRQREPRITVVFTRETSAALTCHHCESAPCLKVCPVNALRRDDGAVLVDEQRCIGCRMCAIACPYGAIHPSGTSIAGVAGVAFPTPTQPRSISPLLAWEIGVATCAVKCDLCRDLADVPRCVDECPTGALRIVDRDKLDKELAAKRIGAVGSLPGGLAAIESRRRI